MDLLAATKKDQEVKERLVLEMRQQVAELAPYKEQAFQLKANLVVLEEKMRFREDENKRLHATLAAQKSQQSSDAESMTQRICGLEERVGTLQSQLTRASEERDRYSAAAQRSNNDSQSFQRQLTHEKQQMQDTVNSLRAQLQQREDTIMDLQRRSAESLADAQRCETQVISLGHELADCRSHMNRLAEEVSSLRANREKVICDLQDVTRHRDSLENQVTTLRREVDRIPNLLEQLETEKQMRTHEVRAKDEALNEAATRLSVVQRANEDIPNLRRRTEDAQAKSEHVHQLLLTAQRQLEETALALREAVQGKEEALQDIANTCNIIIRGIAPLSPRANATRSYKTALQHLKTVVADMSSELTTLRGQVTDLEAHRETLASERNALLRRVEEERVGALKAAQSVQSTTALLAQKDQDHLRYVHDVSTRLREVMGYLGDIPLSPKTSATHVGQPTTFALLDFVDALAARVRILQQAKESVERKATHHEKAMEDVQRALADTRQQLTAAYTQMKDNQVAYDSQIQQNLKTQRDRLSAEYESHIASITTSLRDAEAEVNSLRHQLYELRSTNDEAKLELAAEKDRAANRASTVDQMRRNIETLEREVTDLRRQSESDAQRFVDVAERHAYELNSVSATRDELHQKLIHVTTSLDVSRKELDDSFARLAHFQHNATHNQSIGDASWNAVCSLAIDLYNTRTSLRTLRYNYRTLSRLYMYTDNSFRHLTSVCLESLGGRGGVPHRSRTSFRAAAIAVLAAKRILRLRPAKRSLRSGGISPTIPPRDSILTVATTGSPSDVASDVLRIFFGTESNDLRHHMNFDLLHRLSRGKVNQRHEHTDSMATVVAEVMRMKHTLQRHESISTEKDELIRKYETQAASLRAATHNSIPEDLHQAIVKELREAQEELSMLRAHRSRDMHDLTRTHQDVLRRTHESEDLQRQLREALHNVSLNASLHPHTIEWNDRTSTVLPPRDPLNTTSTPTRRQVSPSRRPISPPPSGAVSSQRQHHHVNISQVTPPVSPRRPVHVNAPQPSQPSDASSLLEVMTYIRQLDNQVSHALHH